MKPAAPRLRDHLLDPSGGLVYHLRAARHRHGLWAPFHTSVARWLGRWQPGGGELVIVGPSAGYALPAGFLTRFTRVTALEPDPLARWLLRRRPDAHHLRFAPLDSLGHADGLGMLAMAFPDAAFLFSNVLGQREAPGDSWSALLRRHLAARCWASYHDVIATPTPPRADAPAHATAGGTLADVLAHFWQGGELPVHDHATFRLGGTGPFDYAPWQITPRRWHLVEWAENPGRPAQAQASTRPPGDDADADADAA